MPNEEQKNRMKKIAPYALVVIASIWIWYLTIPAVVMWLVVKKTKLSKLKKILVCTLLFVVALPLWGSLLDTPKATPTIIEPQRIMTPEEKAEKAAKRTAADEAKRQAEEERLTREQAEQEAKREAERQADEEKLQSYYDRAMSYDEAGASGYRNVATVMEGNNIFQGYQAVTLGDTIMTNVWNNYIGLKNEVALTNKEDETKLKEALSGFIERYSQRKHGMRNLLNYMDENKLKYLQDAKDNFSLAESYLATAKTKLAELEKAYVLKKWPPD